MGDKNEQVTVRTETAATRSTSAPVSVPQSSPYVGDFMRAFLLCSAVAFLALGITERAQAQRGGVRGGYSYGPGWSGGLGYSGGNYYRGYGHGNAHAYPYSGYGYGYGSSYAYPNLGYGYTYPFHGYSYGNTSAYPAYYGNDYRTYYAPSYSGDISPSAYQQALPRNQTVIRVLVPDPDAVVQFDGQKTSSLGRERIFNAPNVEAGSTYSYHVTASWMQDGRTVNEARTVRFVAGQSSVVDFTRAAPAESLAQPAKTSLPR
jgi:uncharacterized protein (TIGR03000 family)